MKKLLVPVLATLLVVGAMSRLATAPAPKVMEPPPIALGELAGYTSEKLDVTETELRVLPADTRFDKRMYHDDAGHWYAVSVVIGGSSKSSIHRPELCLPSQGFLMVGPHTVSAANRSWRMMKLERGPSQAPLGFAYTFFNQTGFSTSSHMRRIFRDICDRSFLNRIDRWVMITVNTSRSDEKEVRAFLDHLKGTLP